MLRQSLLIGVAGMAFAGAGAAEAQQRGQSRDDLLDALTRHIQICGEMTETHMQPLDKRARLQELARLLGGSEVTRNTLANAKELLAA